MTDMEDRIITQIEQLVRTLGRVVGIAETLSARLELLEASREQALDRLKALEDCGGVPTFKVNE